MAIDLDNAAADPGVAADPFANLSTGDTIVDPTTMLPFETPPLSSVVADEHAVKPPAPPPATTPPGDAAARERFEYWQSQADRERNARLALEQELRVARPVMQLIEQDDELYKAVTSRLDGAQPAQPTLKGPTPPERPSSYSEAEAYTNPQSESAKFRVAQEKFVLDRMSYLEALNQQTVEQGRAREAQLAEQTQRSQVLAQTEKLVQTQYGLSPGEAREFTEWSSSDNNVTIPNLVAFYRFLKAGGKVPGGPPSVPVPPTRGGGAPPVTADANAEWNRAMFGARKR